MAKEAAYRREDEPESLRDTIDSERREEAGNYQFPPTPANDNESSAYSRNTNIKNVRTARSGRSVAKPKLKPKKIVMPSVKTESRNIVLAWRNFALVAGATSIIYPIQLFFSILTLIGFGVLAGIESDWLLSAVNFGTFGTVAQAGGGLVVLGMAGAFLCGFISFLGATTIYSAIDRSILHGWSILILTLCFMGLLLPIINILPVMLFWYYYMAFAK